MTRQQKDNIALPFTINTASGFGRIVRLGSILNSILTRHEYPEAVSITLGKLLAFGVSLSTALKYEGILTIEIKSNGSVPLMVADITSDGNIRGYANVKGNISKYDTIKDTIMPHLFQKGTIMFTIDPFHKGRKYQGIIEISHNSLEESLKEYFKQSTQSLSIFKLACQHTEFGWRAGSVSLQRPPEEPNKHNIEQKRLQWEHATILLLSTTEEELISHSLSSEELLLRLYHQDGVKIYEEKNIKDICRCSREKMLNAILSIPKDEIETIFNAEGKIEIHCQYCNKTKIFKKEDIGFKYS